MEQSHKLFKALFRRSEKEARLVLSLSFPMAMRSMPLKSWSSWCRLIPELSEDVRADRSCSMDILCVGAMGVVLMADDASDSSSRDEARFINDRATMLNAIVDADILGC